MSNSCGSEGLIKRAAAQYAARYAMLSGRADGTYRLIVDVVVGEQVVEVEVKQVAGGSLFRGGFGWTPAPA